MLTTQDKHNLFCKRVAPQGVDLGVSDKVLSNQSTNMNVT